MFGNLGPLGDLGCRVGLFRGLGQADRTAGEKPASVAAGEGGFLVQQAFISGGSHSSKNKFPPIEIAEIIMTVFIRRSSKKEASNKAAKE